MLRSEASTCGQTCCRAAAGVVAVEDILLLLARANCQQPDCMEISRVSSKSQGHEQDREMDCRELLYQALDDTGSFRIMGPDSTVLVLRLASCRCHDTECYENATHHVPGIHSTERNFFAKSLRFGCVWWSVAYGRDLLRLSSLVAAKTMLRE